MPARTVAVFLPISHRDRHRIDDTAPRNCVNAFTSGTRSYYIQGSLIEPNGPVTNQSGKDASFVFSAQMHRLKT
ncbi:MAG: hypothetical protein ABSG53_23265, partial [Thermoguttaceae bacterium]